MARTQNLDRNVAAFLDTIAFSEGTIDLGDEGYNVIVGGKLFDSYEDHPKIVVDLPKLKIKSTAAGRYQVLLRYFTAYKKMLSLPDFSPISQDAIAVQMIREQRAINDVIAGRFDIAAGKVSNIWASFPGAGYGQHENKLDKLRNKFVEFGGVLA